MDTYPWSLSGRLALFYRSIEKARAEHYSWAQIRAALVDGGVISADTKVGTLATTWKRVRVAVESGRMAAGEKPLPGTKPQPAMKQNESRPLPTVQGQSPRPLPTVPGQKIPDPDEVQDEFAKHGLKFR